MVLGTQRGLNYQMNNHRQLHGAITDLSLGPQAVSVVKLVMGSPHE